MSTDAVSSRGENRDGDSPFLVAAMQKLATGAIDAGFHQKIIEIINWGFVHNDVIFTREC